jgi:hypothetical protein
MGQRGPAPKPANLKQLYRAHERRAPVGNPGSGQCWAVGLGRERQMVSWSASQEPASKLQQYTHLVGDRMAITCRKSSRKAKLMDEPIRGVQSGWSEISRWNGNGFAK